MIHAARAFAALFLLIAAIGACGPGEVCKPGETQPCQCLDLAGTKACKADGTGFEVCRCGNVSTEPSDEPGQEPTTSETTPDEPMAADEPPATPDEPAVADEPGAADEPSSEPLPEPDASETTPEPQTCTTGEFSYQGKCYKNEDFCKGQIQEPGFPAFTQNDQKAMKEPFTPVFDNITKKPLFCETKDGYYYLSGAGYGVCDLDGDGWINIEAYRALTSAERVIQDNARCKLKTFEHVVYHAEGQAPQVQKLKAKASMVETFRNDGGEKLIELPLYTKDQAALPKNTSSTCTSDADCSGQVCYRGHCLEGRRFAPAEINTLTKGCIAGLDLNDNQLDDANESPSSIPTPAGEFGPLVAVGYFMELHHGHFQVDYDNAGTKIPVYHIYERERSKATDQQGLALNCQQQTDAFQPDYWKQCDLKDNQQCPDPNDPTKLKKGHNACWMPDVKRRLPSLFQCVVFDNTAGYHFNPTNYGFANHYNRPSCNAKAALNTSDPTKRDIEFTCAADDGSSKPDPAKQEVGWACLSFQSYNAPDDYEGGCVDQTAEKVCGTKEGGEDVTYIKVEDGSYGLARATAPCGTTTGQGQCSKARKTCTGGAWLACNKCDNCPQQTTGQKTICPGGVWPADSCKLLSGPSTEICDGIDNDCDGSIDEGLPLVSFYLDKDGDGYGAGTPIQRCAAQKPKGYANKSGDCDDNDKLTLPGAPEICDGQDNNCNGQADENVTKSDFFRDDDLDGFRGAFAFQGCFKPNTNNQIICRGANDCISVSYGSNNAKYLIKDTKAADCCDSNKDVFPGQTNYFGSPYTCGGNPSFDYNCNQREDKEVGTCQCSKTVKYNLTHSIMCRYGNNSFDKNWSSHEVGPSSCGSSGGTCTKTLTNQNSLDSCLIDVTHTFNSTGSHSEKKTCCAGGSKTYRCSSFTAASYKPEYNPSGGTPQQYLVFHNSGWKPVNNKCAFYTNGAAVKCGDSGVSILETNDAITAPSRIKSSTFCKTTSSACCGNTWTGECKWTFNINYNNADYKYFSNGAKQFGQTVKCR